MRYKKMSKREKAQRAKDRRLVRSITRAMKLEQEIIHIMLRLRSVKGKGGAR